jgi:hypothetical protein
VSGAVGTTRNPVTTWLLVLITFGIYLLYWWYKTNEEVAEYDPSIEVKPVLSVLALFVPICNIVTIWRTGSRIGQAQRTATGTASCSGGIGFLLALLLSLNFVYYQAQLNDLWKAVPQAGSGPAPEPPGAQPPPAPGA